MRYVYDYYERFDEIKKRPNEFMPADRDDSLKPPVVIVNPTDPMYKPDMQYMRTNEFSVCKTKKGRIFNSYFSGGTHGDEDVGNWGMIVSSDDGGKTFVDKVAINPYRFDNCRIFEVICWLDPKGRLWCFFVQCYKRFDSRLGVWSMRCDNPDADNLVFTAPKRICDGIQAVPTVLKDGRWILTAYLSSSTSFHGDMHSDFDTADIFYIPEKIGISVYASDDEGETFKPICKPLRFPYASFYENIIIEKKDGSLWILVRGKNCVGQAFSYDGGYTWTPVTVNGAWPLPDTHFYMNRLKDGNLLFLCNYRADMYTFFQGRNNLTALISRDDGETWEGKLILDERDGCGQPAFFEDDEGHIYIVYERAPQIAGESLLAIVTEEEILAGKIYKKDSVLKRVIGKATGMKKRPDYDVLVKIAKQYNIDL